MPSEEAEPDESLDEEIDDEEIVNIVYRQLDREDEDQIFPVQILTPSIESDIFEDNHIEMDESDNFTKDVNDIISNLLVEPVLSEDETDHINMLIKSLVDY